MVISPHAQVHTNAAKSLEILEEAVLSVEKNMINCMENQLVYRKYYTIAVLQTISFRSKVKNCDCVSLRERCKL